MISFAATLALVLVVDSSASAPRAEQVEAYYAAARRGDEAGARKFLAPDARIWFEKREGPGEPWNVSGGSWDHWDSYFNGKVVRSEWEAGPDFVSARGDETNDYYRLLDWKPWPMKLTWWFDESGRMNGFLVQSVVGEGTTGSRLKEFKEWAKVKRPEELQYLMPKGQIDPSSDRAERWRTILVEWRREAGLPPVALGPPGVSR